MGRPYRNGRKGRMLRVQELAHQMTRWWYVYRGDWQPTPQNILQARRDVEAMRKALDELEAVL